MRLIFALLIVAQSCWAGPDQTVIVDIHGIGPSKLAQLRDHPSVRWSAEFGNELLLGVSDDHWGQWLARPDTHAGPGPMRFSEVVVRDHVCTLHDHEPSLAVIGGYEILRKPATLARATRGAMIPGEPLPPDGVVAREVNNEMTPVVRGNSNPEVQALVDRVNADRWFATLSTLAGFDRNSFNPDLSQAHDWIQTQFAQAGLQTASFPFQLDGAVCSPPRPSVNLANPIGFKPGTDLASEWVVVGAHYDARNANRCDGAASPQPGANDNGSGCAGVIELARVMQTADTRRSIVFICFAGEEQGLVGSRRYVESLQVGGQIAQVRYMLNLDMIGHAVDDSLSARVETLAVFSSELNRYAQAAATYAPELNLITSSATQAYSDHWYFLNAGVPGVFTWENGAAIYPQYHQSGDRPENMLRARPLAAGILKMDVAILVEEAALSTLFRDSFESP